MKTKQIITIAFIYFFVSVNTFAQEIFPLKIPQKILSDGEQFYDFELYNLTKNSRKKIVSNVTEASNSCFGSNQFIITNFDEIKTFSLIGKLTSSKKIKEPLLIVGSTLSFDKKNLILLMANNQTNKFSIWEYSLSKYSLKNLIDNLGLNISLESLKVKIKSFKNNHIIVENSDLSVSEIDLSNKNILKKIKLEQSSEEQCAYTFLSFYGDSELYISYSNDCKSFELLKKGPDNKNISLLKSPITRANFPIMLNKVELDAVLVFTGKETYTYKQSKLFKIANINPKSILYFDNSNIIFKNLKGSIERVKY